MHRNFHKDIFTKKNCKRIVDFKNKIQCFLPNLFAACGLGLNSKKIFFLFVILDQDYWAKLIVTGLSEKLSCSSETYDINYSAYLFH